MDAPEIVRAPVPRAGKGAARPVPERNGDYAHLTLDALRSYRKALHAEENKVSYWRRILQARLDVLREGRVSGRGGTLDADALRPVLATERVSSGRSALVEVLGHDDIPPLPNLAELWDRRVEPGDTEAEAQLDADLSEAESQLSDYRAALHRRLADATGELIARYREQPALCLSALPLPPQQRHAV